jgi:hypothetical protein
VLPHATQDFAADTKPGFHCGLGAGIFPAAEKPFLVHTKQDFPAQLRVRILKRTAMSLIGERFRNSSTTWKPFQ